MPKYSRRVKGFHDAVISLYAKGLTTGEIQADKVFEDLNSWQARPLDRRRFLTNVAK
uniref:transposase n=1 Tax=Saccharomonospora TaxID=1851 RepID=UPI0036F34784